MFQPALPRVGSLAAALTVEVGSVAAHPAPSSAHKHSARYSNAGLVADGKLDLTTDPDRPQLFGMPFDGPMLGHEAEMPIHYDLHVWLYRHNPAGQFAMWNPQVDCPDEKE
jgi:hypothetical protein